MGGIGIKIFFKKVLTNLTKCDIIVIVGEAVFRDMPLPKFNGAYNGGSLRCALFLNSGRAD